MWPFDNRFYINGDSFIEDKVYSFTDNNYINKPANRGC